MTAWQHRAACVGEDPHLFFLEEGEHLSEGRFNEAEELCRACPVVAQCEAEQRRNKFGFWAHKLLDPVKHKRMAVTI